jgi:hypothetical protein
MPIFLFFGLTPPGVKTHDYINYSYLVVALHWMFTFYLQGLCKLGSAGGSDASDKQLAEGSTLTLAKVCRKYVINKY